MKVLVTGVAGFVGSNLARDLIARGHEVSGIDNLTAGTRDNVPAGVLLHVADIRDAAVTPLFSGIDAVYHLAAKNCLTDCMDNPSETADINVRGTALVLESARRAGVKRFIYADSSAEYEGVREFPCRVDRIAPEGIYAVSKRGGALFCQSYRKYFGLDVVILRYFNVYGPAQDFRRVIPPVMSAFILKMLTGEAPVIYGTGEKRRDFIYVDDVNRFQTLVLEDPRAVGGTFNVGSGVSHSVNDVFRIIENELKSGLTPVHKPELPNDVDNTLADISAGRELGWAPEIDIREGVRRTIAYLKSRLAGARS